MNQDRDRKIPWLSRKGIIRRLPTPIELAIVAATLDDDGDDKKKALRAFTLWKACEDFLSWQALSQKAAAGAREFDQFLALPRLSFDDALKKAGYPTKGPARREERFKTILRDPEIFAATFSGLPNEILFELIGDSSALEALVRDLPIKSITKRETEEITKRLKANGVHDMLCCSIEEARKRAISQKNKAAAKSRKGRR